MWIHEQNDWPNFTWNIETLTTKLTKIRYTQGRLMGRMESLGFEFSQQAKLITLTNDVLTSSAIEGEYLEPEAVRSSIAGRLGIEMAGLTPASRNLDGVVEMMLDATQQFDNPVTEERLFSWQAALFPTGRSGMHEITVGAWRTAHKEPMQVISGPIGREYIHYEAPHAERLPREMGIFLDWVDGEDKTDLVLKSGLAHLWFVSIHPFEDGNGRIARAIADMILARADSSPDRFFSLSTQLESERKDYYSQLERQQRSTTDVTFWLEWYLDCLGRAIANSEASLNSVLFKAKLWEKINQHSISNRQRIVINRMLEDGFEGHMNTSKYARIARCSNDTALRDIRELTALQIFVRNPGSGRSTSYRTTDVIPQ